MFEHGHPLYLQNYCMLQHNTLYQHYFVTLFRPRLSIEPSANLHSVKCESYLRPCPHKLCTTLSAFNIPQLFVSDQGRPSRASTRRADRK